MSNPAVPAGYLPHDRHSPLTAPWEPIYARRESDCLILGLRVRPEHCNSRGMVHGGLLAALADNAMGLSCGVVLESRGQRPAGGLVTTSLAVDYLGKADQGQWLEFDTVFVRPGRTLCVAQCFVTADGEVIARANATFRVA